MTNNEQYKLEKLECQAVQFAAQMFSRTLREPLESQKLQRLKRIAEKAGKRAERRYQASLKACRKVIKAGEL